MMTPFKDIQVEMSEWHDRNFPKSTPENDSKKMLIGVMEELGELAHAVLKKEQLGRESLEEEKDAVGDITNFLMQYCTERGFHFCSVVEEVWHKVKERDYRNAEEAVRIG